MSRKLVGHIHRSDAQCRDMVLIVSVQVLHIVGAGVALQVSARAAFTVSVLVIDETEIVEALLASGVCLVCPKIAVHVTRKHHRSMTTDVRIVADCRIVSSGAAECSLKVH